MMIGAVVGWIVLGLVAGFLGRAIHPGRDAMGWGSTMVLGIMGSLLGGGLAYVLKLAQSPYSPGGWILATVGSVVLLAFGWFGSRRSVTV